MGDFLLLVSLAVFVWAVVGLVNPQVAKLPNRIWSVGIWILSLMLAGAGASLSQSPLWRERGTRKSRLETKTENEASSALLARLW